MSETGSSLSYANLVVIFGTALVFVLTTGLLGISVGSSVHLALIGFVFVAASAVSWYGGFVRAGLGYLLVVASAAVLASGIKGDPVAAVAFFGCLLAGFGFVVSEGIHEAEKKDRARTT